MNEFKRKKERKWNGEGEGERREGMNREGKRGEKREGKRGEKKRIEIRLREKEVKDQDKCRSGKRKDEIKISVMR
jgi:hypothetical protein